MDVQGIDQLAQRLASLVPPGLAQAREDMQANFKDILAQGLRRLDLVTREEFDVQSQVLARTRERLEALEQRLAELEASTQHGPLDGHRSRDRPRSVTLTPRAVGGGYFPSERKGVRMRTGSLQDRERSRFLAMRYRLRYSSS